MENTDNFHAHYRKQLRQKILWNGTDTLCDKELLEVLLFTAVPHLDAKKISKQLLTRFGSLEKIFAASGTSLMKTENIGEQTAVFFQAVKELTVRLDTMPSETFDSVSAIGEYFVEKCAGARSGRTLLLFLDKDGRKVEEPAIFPGTEEAALQNLKNHIQNAVPAGAVTIAVAQNHLSGAGTSFANAADKAAMLHTFVTQNGLHLLEFFVISGESYLRILKGKKQNASD